MTEGAISLVELNRRIGRALNVAAGLNGVWVTGETSDLRVSGGHCYMELIEKADNGTPLAKVRAVAWASTFAVLARRFSDATGAALRSDMKILVRVNVNFHAVYGLSLVITDIDPDYTVGDLARRRNEIIARLKAEGVYDLNRELPWPALPRRVAVISARGAAGYGDFVKHLHANPLRLRFTTTLYEAPLQGERTSPGVIAALDAIMARVDNYDCVVIIRGGGAVADLAWFDDYDLALNVASFPLPVIVGIGHERDVTVLDYVANTRVKTPTAAAEALVDRMSRAYNAIGALGSAILEAVRGNIGSQKQYLAYCQGLLPASAQAIIDRGRMRLDSYADLIEALSPQATLRRGYSITRVGGHAITDAAAIVPGTAIHTTLASGETIVSTAAAVGSDC